MQPTDDSLWVSDYRCGPLAGDESTAIEYFIGDAWSDALSYGRVIVREGRILIEISGRLKGEARWGPGPIDIEYFSGLARAVAERTERVQTALQVSSGDLTPGQ